MNHPKHKSRICLPSLKGACDLVYIEQNRGVIEIIKTSDWMFRRLELEKTEFQRKINTPDWCIDLAFDLTMNYKY